MSAALLILRHGNTFDKGDVVLRVGARTDLPLSQSGRLQIASAGRFIAAQYGPINRIITGPLLRTRQTAEIIAEHLTPKPPITIGAGLKEIDYGPDEGKPEQEVRTRIGEQAIAAWEENAIVPPGWQVDPAALTAIWKSLLQQAFIWGGRTVAVTSNGIARFALPAVDEIKHAVPQKLRTGAFGHIAIDEHGKTRLESWDQRG